MDSEAGPVHPLLRIYAWLALIGWFAGIPATLLLSVQSGSPPWPMFLVIAASAPLVPLLTQFGSGILAHRLEGLFHSRRVRGGMTVAWAIVLVLMAGMCFFAWATYDEGRTRNRVRDFVNSLSADAHVLVDGEYFLGDRKRALLQPLATLSQRPAHHSHPEEAFLVVLIDGERRMELELCRDSDRRREYWVYLYGESEIRDRNDVGRITTDVLDDLVPVRPPKMRRAHDPNFR